MKFELHKKFRFEWDYTDEEYRTAEEEYLEHLRTIDFKKRKSLVCYFGKSFFHDAILKNIHFDLKNKKVTLKLYTFNDLQDINDFRNKKGYKSISEKVFSKNPVLYKCIFDGLIKISLFGNIDLSEELTIVDTELDFHMKDKSFITRISFSENDELNISFKGKVSVNIVDKGLVEEYLKGLRKTIPYCKTCKSRMLSISDLK